jgi:hypothetical protein
MSDPPALAPVFTELVCADPELLRAEFEALIAANYPPGDGHRNHRPPRQTRPLRTDRARPAPRASSSRRPGLWSRPGGRAGPTGADRAPRERGPPWKHPHPAQRARTERRQAIGR